LKYILFIFFPYLYLFLLCGLNPLKITCIFYNFENETSSNDDLKYCMILNNKKKLKLVTDTEIKENEQNLIMKNIL
jgi:hypothetical protein